MDSSSVLDGRVAPRPARESSFGPPRGSTTGLWWPGGWPGGRAQFRQKCQNAATGPDRVLFVNRSRFYLSPTVVRPYAPVGQTPILHEQLTCDHLSVISGITLEGKLNMMGQGRAFKSPDVVSFLRHVLRQIQGKLLVIWGGSPIHCGQAVKDFLASGAAENRLQLEQLPGYAPDLNPDEGVWKHLRYMNSRTSAARAFRS